MVRLRRSDMIVTPPIGPRKACRALSVHGTAAGPLAPHVDPPRPDGAVRALGHLADREWQAGGVAIAAAVVNLEKDYCDLVEADRQIAEWEKREAEQVARLSELE